MKTINERIQFIINEKKMNYSTFGESIQSSGQVIRSICTGRNKPSYDVIEAIILNYPEIDVLWFTIGIGDFLRHDTMKDKEIVDMLKKENEVLVKNNDSLLKDKERLWELVEDFRKKLESNEPTRNGNVVVLDTAVYNETEYKKAS
jgi:hypothetical protein